MRERIIQALDNPSTLPQRLVALGLLFVIYISVAQVVIEFRYPGVASKYSETLSAVGLVVLLIFTAELVIRLICDERGWRYLLSFYGLVDLIAVLPGLASALLGLPIDALWVRVLRIARFARALKFVRMGNVLGGVTGRLAPFFALAIGLKGIAVAFEAKPWWPQLGDLNVVIGVTGFALAIMLGTKMRVISSRLYQLEDTIARVVGAVRDMQSNEQVGPYLRKWSHRLEDALSAGDRDSIRAIKTESDKLEAVLASAGIGGPAITAFHRDVEYVLHRATTGTPQAYERFLRNITMAYAVVVILAVPGLTGFVATLLLIQILGGMYLLIDDMDRPLERGENSLVTIDLTALREFNESAVPDANPA